MGEKMMQENPPEKVLALYQAVIDMVNGGCDINGMKVSDITARAGIGKGTAYEYFSSKEEIITHAIAFDVLKKREYLSRLVEGDKTFREKVMGILDYIEEKFGENQTFCMFVRIGTGSYEISEALKAEYQKMFCHSRMGELMDSLVDVLMAQGADEGEITQPDICLRRMAFGAQIMGFSLCLVAKSMGKEFPVSVEQAKSFVYASLVKTLN